MAGRLRGRGSARPRSAATPDDERAQETTPDHEELRREHARVAADLARATEGQAGEQDERVPDLEAGVEQRPEQDERDTTTTLEEQSEQLTALTTERDDLRDRAEALARDLEQARRTHAKNVDEARAGAGAGSGLVEAARRRVAEIENKAAELAERYDLELVAEQRQVDNLSEQLDRERTLRAQLEDELEERRGGVPSLPNSQQSAAAAEKPLLHERIPGFLEYHPSSRRQRVLGVAFAVIVVAVALSGFAAFGGGSSGSVSLAGGMVGLAAVLWWMLIGWSPTTVSITNGVLEVRRGKVKESFDLRDPATRISVGVEPSARYWSTTLTRPDDSTLVIGKQEVDAAEFVRIVAYFREIAGQHGSAQGTAREA